MAPQRRKKEKFYVVYRGRVDHPTIYSSWSQVHPRVIGCKGAEHEEFHRLDDARNEIKLRGFTVYDNAAAHASENKAMPLSRRNYYAVAGGKTTRVFYSWKDANESIKGTSACHESFSTEQEAEQFIENWKDAYADTWRRAIRQALDDGWRPNDMELDIKSFLVREDCNQENNDNELPKLEQLNIKEEPKK